MNSSGMKRGLAATAISALAVTGLPFLATSASATPISTEVGANQVELFAPLDGMNISEVNDGTNTSVSLVAGLGSGVTNVQFRYSVVGSAEFVNIGSPVAVNTDGVAQMEWDDVPTTVDAVQAVGDVLGAEDTNAVTNTTATSPDANTIELSTEGRRGVFVSPYGATTTGDAGDEAAHDGDYVAVTGTTHEEAADSDITVTDVSHDTAGAWVTESTTDADGSGSGTTGAFFGSLDIDGYTYDAGGNNQIALNGASTDGLETYDDAEGSTLYGQTLTTITASSLPVDNPDNAVVTLTVTDQDGKPVSNAQVYAGGDTATGGTDTDTDGAQRLVGYTNAMGQVKDSNTEAGVAGGTGPIVYWTNRTDVDAKESADPTTSHTLNAYTPVIDSVDIVNLRNRTNFDLEELADGDDFVVEILDQQDNPIAGEPVQYRWVIDPSGTGPTSTTDWTTAADTDADGRVAVAGLTDGMYDDNTSDLLPANDPIPEGTYTLEARKAGENGGQPINATPETITGDESEITFDEGNSANATASSTFTVTGKLANANGGLAGRRVVLDYAQDGAGNADFAPQSEQPAGVTIAGTTATVITGADGSFSVKLKDPAVASNQQPTPESGELNAIAYEAGGGDPTSLQGDNGPDEEPENNPDSITPAPNTQDNAEEYLSVNWRVLPADVEINLGATGFDQINPGQNDLNEAVPFGPGRPAGLDVEVYADTDGDGQQDGNEPSIQDYPFSVSVDKGFLSPDAEDANGVTLDDAHDADGDLWGFFKNDGQSVNRSTGDSAEGGALIAIERDSGFDDDGQVTVTVTITAGDETLTREITMDNTAPINTASASIERADGGTGSAKIGDEVPMSVEIKDQFDNLVGDNMARISDDSTVADFRTDEDFDFTLTDFTTSNPGVVAFSDAKATQTLTAMLNQQRTLVAADGNQNDDRPAAPTSAQVSDSSDPINWVAGDKVKPEVVLSGKDNDGATDRLKADAIDAAAGAKAVLKKKIRKGVWKTVGQKVLNGKGNARFRVADKNGKKVTTYRVKLSPTERTLKDRSTTEVR